MVEVADCAALELRIPPARCRLAGQGRKCGSVPAARARRARGCRFASDLRIVVIASPAERFALAGDLELSAARIDHQSLQAGKLHHIVTSGHLSASRATRCTWASRMVVLAGAPFLGFGMGACRPGRTSFFTSPAFQVVPEERVLSWQRFGAGFYFLGGRNYTARVRRWPCDVASGLGFSRRKKVAASPSREGFGRKAADAHQCRPDAMRSARHESSQSARRFCSRNRRRYSPPVPATEHVFRRGQACGKSTTDPVGIRGFRRIPAWRTNVVP
jgi:hypothetical protein